MKKLMLLALLAPLGLMLGCAQKPTFEMPLYAVTNADVGQQVGFVQAFDTADGLRLSILASGFTPGLHGFHIHENPSCKPATGPDGKPAAALAAGGHFDPDHTGQHTGPLGTGHKGDLPPLLADANGQINTTVTAPRLTTADLKGHSLIIHAGADNFSDTPQPLGGGGARVACGVLVTQD